MSKYILSQSVLKEILCYDKDTGIFTRKKKTNNSVKVGAVTGYKSKSGYLITTITNKQFYLHRMAWLYVYGEMPDGQIDHINHNRADNRIDNLRVVTKNANSKNMALSKSSSSGITGVYQCRTSNKWIARITVDNKQLTLGTFDTKLEAHKKRKESEIEHGFHKNHGVNYHG